MKSILINYEIESGENMDFLLDRLEQVTGTFWHKFSESAWVINTRHHPDHLLDLIKPFLFPDDKVFIVELGTKAIWQGYDYRDLDWLNHSYELKRHVLLS